jgi:hypothetical protein
VTYENAQLPSVTLNQEVIPQTFFAMPYRVLWKGQEEASKHSYMAGSRCPQDLRKDKESDWSLIPSACIGTCTVIIILILPGWLISAAAATLFNWGFGFGFGWYFSLLTILPIMLCRLGLAASLIIWQEMRTA